MLVKKKIKAFERSQKIAQKEIWYSHSGISETQSMITTRLRFIRNCIKPAYQTSLTLYN